MMNLKVDRTLARAAGPDRRHIMVELAAPEAPAGTVRPPLNVALVIDRSGSMRGAKLEYAREAAMQVLRALGEGDRFAVVAYDDAVEVVWPSAAVTVQAVDEAIERIGAIEARGCTDLHSGWLRGCEQVARHQDPEALHRVLLLSDGLANRGLTDRSVIAREASDLRERGVRTSTFGVGADFDENLLQGMATAGGGQFYFIEHAAQVPEILQSELGEALQTVARDVELRASVPTGARAELLNDYPATRQGDTLTVKVGDLTSRQRLSLLLAIDIPGGAEGSTVPVTVAVADRDGALGAPAAEVAFRRAADIEHVAQQRELAVERAVALLQATLARREALEDNRAGDFERARRRLEQTAGNLFADADGDEAIQKLAADLRDECASYGMYMDAVEMKQAHFHSASLLKSRHADGRAARGPDDGARRASGARPGRRAPRTPEETYPLDTAHDHPVALIDGKHVLLDTGSPVSIGSGAVRILGREHQVQPGLGLVTVEEISRLVGTRVDLLLGTDVLANLVWVLDWDRGTVRFLDGPGVLAGPEAPVSLRYGVPAVEIGLEDGTRTPAFLDTGARLSYLGADVPPGAPSLGEEEDFFPLLGRFRVPVHLCAVELAGERREAAFGTLPPAFELTLGLAGVTWILGAEFLRGREVLFDIGAGRVVFGGARTRAGAC